MQARKAMVLRGGANAATEGERKRMPVTKRSLAVMPSVANGVRTHAWKAEALPSGMGFLAGQCADLLHQVRGNGDALALRALAVGATALARQAHVVVGQHG